MRLPKSVWVVVSPRLGPVEAYFIHQKPNDVAWLSGSMVVRYVLPAKPKPRKRKETQ